MFLKLLFLATLCGLGSGLECAYYSISGCEGSGGCNRTEICGSEDPSTHTLACFTLWERSPTTGEDVLHKQGCFINDKQCIGVSSCVDKGATAKPLKNSQGHIHYCCCDGDLCNNNYSWIPNPTETPVNKTIVQIEASLPPWTLIAVLITTFVVCCFIAALLMHRRVQSKPPPSNVTDEENILLDTETVNASVTLIELKAQGRFGQVWKASMANKEEDLVVAVKILPFREKTSWRLEQEVYSLPLMCDCKLILGYFGARSDPEMQLWLISEYIVDGSLYDYLKGHELSWSDVLKVGISMCRGLAFLHEEMDADKGKGVKPAVAHRDFKSKNVLLRPDLTACIADFGLAHIFYPTKPVGTNHGQVGTRRYMAPEVLDGAVSFTRDNFQRIDMYACGLVLWELASRCTVAPLGEYRLPFEEHVGMQPSLEEMIECVVSQRKRPTVRPDWYSHPGLSVLCDAIKDSWDQDAEARISASCIVERLNSISNKL